MLYPPANIKEARQKRYDKWAGNPAGNPYVENRCAYEVRDFTGWHYYQCSFKNGKGTNGLYCGVHAKKVT